MFSSNDFSYQSTQINETVLSSRQTFHIPKKKEATTTLSEKKKNVIAKRLSAYYAAAQAKQCQTKNVIHFG